MARSSYIYIVNPAMGTGDVEAFTVKHEAQRWIARGLQSDWLSPDGEVVRVGDGGPAAGRKREVFSLDSFLAS
jgi:hypothetical protein